MALGVTVDFNANLVKFSAQMDKMAGQLDKFQRHAETMSSRVNSALAGLGVGLSGGGLLSFVKSGIDAADALNDLADRSGIAIEKLAGLEHAVKIGDTSIESFVSASNKLSINISKNAEDFAKLGITASDPVDAFMQLADVFSSIEDPQQRAAFGAAALGKSYAEMAPLLMMGADGIQELIDKGREYNPVTAEQARLAGELNDKIGELQSRFQGFSLVIAGPVVDSLNEFGRSVEFAIAQADGFHPLEFMTDFANGATKADQLGRLNYLIRDTGKALDEMENQGVGGQMIDYMLGNSYEETYSKLVKLQTARDKLLPKDTPTPNKSSASDAFDRELEAFIKKGSAEEAAAKKAESQAKKAVQASDNRLKSINDVIEGLQRDIEISRLSEDQQRQAVELSNALKNARGAEVQTITDLVNAKYNQIEVDKRQSEQWQQLISDANDYYDLRKSIGQLSDTNLTLDSFSGGIGQIQDQLNAGVINPDQAKALFDQLGQSYNTSFIEPAKTGTDQLSEYGIQAARNMQTAFADFLFDPFDTETGGMVDNFLTAIRRMASEAAAANLAELLFGGGPTMKDNNGVLREVVGWIGSAVGSYFGGAGSSGVDAFGANASGRIVSGVFANGGIMTDMGPLPLNKYALGGVANTPQVALFGEGRQPEAYVPLPDGRSIPVSMKDGGRQNVNYITMHITTPNADSFRKSERQIKQQMQRAINV